MFTVTLIFILSPGFKVNFFGSNSIQKLSEIKYPSILFVLFMSAVNVIVLVAESPLKRVPKSISISFSIFLNDSCLSLQIALVMGIKLIENI